MKESEDEMKTVPFTKEDIMNWENTYPTPFYVYDEAAIRKCVTDLYKAFSWNKGFKEYFAVKATPNPAIIRVLKELGCGTDCASTPEIILSNKCGISGHDIIFSSNETTVAEYKAALEAGAIINLDDITHIDFLESIAPLPDTICCRYNPGKFNITNDIMGHLYDSKFGMTPVQIIEAFSILKSKGVKHFGIHAMLASCSLNEEYYPRLANELFTFALKIKEILNINIEFIDLSGGIGIPYKPDEGKVDIFAIGEGVREVYDRIVKPAGLEIALYTEMGRYITGPYGYLVSKAIHHKHIYKEYIGLNASCCDLMRPAMYGAYHHITVMGKENEIPVGKFDVVGSLCENNDKFAVDRELPLVEVGDYITIHDAGAHGHSMGYNYNGKLRCAELMLKPDGNVELIRRAQTAEDYFSTLDIDPAFKD